MEPRFVVCNSRGHIKGINCMIAEVDNIIVTMGSIEIVVDRYRSQIGAYAEALSRIYRMPVKDKYLYLFHLDRFVQV